ncbi:transcriptional repressor [Candidatus Roizmanbacteria bacterium]|nr:transcriptional repressor [Candidatus Roizmanbacteria bacterium]
MEYVETLKKNGYRITKQRSEILNALATYPLSVHELFKILQQKSVKIDLASIYRSLETFERLGLVASSDLGEGKKRYELLHTKHHHHLICTSCGGIEDIDCADIETAIQKIYKNTQFKVERHTLEFFGQCHLCQQL